MLSGGSSPAKLYIPQDDKQWEEKETLSVMFCAPPSSQDDKQWEEKASPIGAVLCSAFLSRR